MSVLVTCPAVSTEQPELAAATEAALAAVVQQHLAGFHPAFSWPDYYVQENCHSAPWVVPCPVVPGEQKLLGPTRSDLVGKVASHVKAAHPTFSWPNWYVTKNCHSVVIPAPTGR